MPLFSRCIDRYVGFLTGPKYSTHARKVLNMRPGHAGEIASPSSLRMLLKSPDKNRIIEVYIANECKRYRFLGRLLEVYKNASYDAKSHDSKVNNHGLLYFTSSRSSHFPYIKQPLY